MQVRLTAPRSRGAHDYVAGDPYDCSEAEGATLIAAGTAVAIKEQKAKIETAATKGPEAAVVDKPRTRKKA